MKHSLFILILIFSSVALAEEEDKKEENDQQPRHLISIGTDGFGWSGTGTVFDLDKDKTLRDDVNTSSGSFVLNYNYIFPTRFMLGGEVDIDYSKTETKFQSGGKITEEARTSTLALSLGYNFNKDIYNSFWLKAFLGAGRVDTQVDDSTIANDDSDTNTSIGFVTLEFGKRFALGGLKFKNFTYSPSIAITRASYGEDANDVGLEASTTAQLNILKFDLVF